jgi:hypothetical protein
LVSNPLCLLTPSLALWTWAELSSVVYCCWSLTFRKSTISILPELCKFVHNLYCPRDLHIFVHTILVNQTAVLCTLAITQKLADMCTISVDQSAVLHNLYCSDLQICSQAETIDPSAVLGTISVGQSAVFLHNFCCPECNFIAQNLCWQESIFLHNL